MNKTLIGNIDLDITLLGGQSFAWDKIGEYYYGITSYALIKCKLEGNKLVWQTYGIDSKPSNDYKLIASYFRTDLDFVKINRFINKDKYVNQAIKRYSGLRLLNQDFRQCLISFIASSSNTIINIRRSIRLMNQKYGKHIKVDGINHYLFPDIDTLAKCSEEEIKECKFGFRSKYILAGAKALSEDKRYLDINNLNEEEARQLITEIPGIGGKIADCILAFSLQFNNVTPVDTWVKKVLSNLYNINEKTKIEEVRTWFNNYFEGHAAFAGQFLFEYVRNYEDSLLSSKEGGSTL